MASKQSLKLFDVAYRLHSVYLHSLDFLRFGIFRVKKQVAIIGNGEDPVVHELRALLGVNCRVTLIQEGTSSKQGKHDPDTFFSIHPDNYKALEASLAGREFNSIIVTPLAEETTKPLAFEDDNFVGTMISLHQRSLMRNMLAYRVAHKYLGKTGVVILSCSQREFLQYKSTQRMQEQAERLHQPYCKDGEVSLLEGLVTAQVACLGFILGDREFTHLHSKSVIALTSQLWRNLDHKTIIAQRYANWATGLDLPSPGSFALFKPPLPTTSTHYVEYL